jgi:hypothetical protein
MNAGDDDISDAMDIALEEVEEAVDEVVTS